MYAVNLIMEDALHVERCIFLLLASVNAQDNKLCTFLIGPDPDLVGGGSTYDTAEPLSGSRNLGEERELLLTI